MSDDRIIPAAVPGLSFQVRKIASRTYFQIIHHSGHPLFRHAINVKGGGGISRMMRVANAIFRKARMDWTLAPDRLDVQRGEATVHEFESWLEDGSYGTQHVRDGAPED